MAFTLLLVTIVVGMLLARAFTLPTKGQQS
jgi:hypothetical protein